MSPDSGRCCYLWKQWGQAGYRNLRKCPQCMEHEQVGARAMAVIKNTGTGSSTSLALP
ncbi:hypothetical protein [Nitrosomonas sp. GH22]|uniref:hypothetical protein n=1 Tax=Nitrosomonas sp. GH22 TaxID=153947 RepID=UPI0019588F6B|nr:hypothetical protein [Nitrosomonas sp. GH22]